MTITDEVLLFARDFINYKSFRTKGRKKKIREVYKEITGENIKISCSTCYLEALFTIIKNSKMATQKYELKKGVVLQAFGDASKTCTNDTITDELGDWYMKNQPEKRVYFSRYPLTLEPIINPEIKIIPPVTEKQPEEIIAETVNQITGKSPKKSKTKK
jgi:hypothetical protein